MWALRILTGPLCGQVTPLKPGKNILGRSPSCDIPIPSGNVSKEHAEVQVTSTHVTIVDRASRNGTFVNGLQVRQKNLNLYDKIAISEFIFEVIQYDESTSRTRELQLAPPSALAPEMHQPIFNSPLDNVKPISSNPTTNRRTVQEYIEEVALPGIYHLSEVFEFKWVVGFLLMGFAVAITVLSLIPLLAITNESIRNESTRRAVTIARNLASLNQAALLQGNFDSNLNTHSTENEEGVSQVLIVRAADGIVLAPSKIAGSAPNLPFIATARRRQRHDSREVVEMIDSSHIAASIPISAFNPESSTYTVKALAIIVYDMGTLAVNDDRTVSLFFQTLILALIVGSLLFYLLYRLIEHPIRSLNKQIDEALRTRSENTSVSIIFPIFQDLVTNVNTLLTRVANGDPSGVSSSSTNRDFEGENIVQLIGHAAFAIHRDQIILGMNNAAEELIGRTSQQMRNQPLVLIPDAALQQKILYLMERCEQDYANIASEALGFAGSDYQVYCQTIMGPKGPLYFVIAVIPSQMALAESGGAA